MIAITSESDNGPIITIGIDRSLIIEMLTDGKSAVLRNRDVRPVTIILFARETDEALAASVRAIAHTLDKTVVEIGDPTSVVLN